VIGLVLIRPLMAIYVQEWLERPFEPAVLAVLAQG